MKIKEPSDKKRIKTEMTFKLASYLEKLKDFETVELIAINLGFETKFVRQNISKVKDILAQKSIMVINKMASGYRTGTEDEYRAELYKSLSRSIANIESALNRLSYLHYSQDNKEFGKKVNLNFKNLFPTIKKASREIQTAIEEANLIPEDSKEGMAIIHAGVKPEFVNND